MRSPTTMPSSRVPGMMAANSSPPRRTTKSVSRRLELAVAANSLITSSPSAWPKRSLIDLKWSRSNASMATGLPAFFAGFSASSRAASTEPRAVEQAGERIGQRRALVRPQRALLGELEHEECSADRVEQHFEDERREPGGGERDQAGLLRHHAGDRDREQEDRAVQRRREQGRP